MLRVHPPVGGHGRRVLHSQANEATTPETIVMAELKTRRTDASVKDFLAGVSNERRRSDSEVVMKIMRKVSRKQARMWGPSIIGYGLSEYPLANGKTGQICKIGFSPRAQALAFYLGRFDGREKLLKTLGKHKLGNGGCLYINKLDDIDLGVLEEMITRSYQSEDGSTC